MKDLTQGPIVRHILAMAAPIALGLIFQTLYFLIDLYFVAQLGDNAIAGVGAAGNATFIIFALTNMLGVGTVAGISQAAGRKAQGDANLLFNQALLLAGAFAIVTLCGIYLLAPVYMNGVAADGATAGIGATYLHWFAPGLALQFPMAAMVSALRATGIVRPTMLVQVLSVICNAVLAPVLIAGWGTGHPLGVAGAGLASTLAALFGVALLTVYFIKLQKYVSFDRAQLRVQLPVWQRILGVGMPAGGEMLLMFVYIGIAYWCIRDLGTPTQAGFGIGSRVMQCIFLPAMAVAFAAGPVVGQNFGARRPERVREALNRTLLLSCCIMASVTLLVQVRPELLFVAFTNERDVSEVAATFLRITSLGFVTQGVIFTCSSVFQGLGNTRPALFANATRLVTFAVPAMWLSKQSFFEAHQLWYLSVTTVALQALVSFALLRQQLRQRLTFVAPDAMAQPVMPT